MNGRDWLNDIDINKFQYIKDDINYGCFGEISYDEMAIANFEFIPNPFMELRTPEPKKKRLWNLTEEFFVQNPIKESLFFDEEIINIYIGYIPVSKKNDFDDFSKFEEAIADDLEPKKTPCPYKVIDKSHSFDEEVTELKQNNLTNSSQSKLFSKKSTVLCNELKENSEEEEKKFEFYKIDKENESLNNNYSPKRPSDTLLTPKQLESKSFQPNLLHNWFPQQSPPRELNETVFWQQYEENDENIKMPKGMNFVTKTIKKPNKKQTVPNPTKHILTLKEKMKKLPFDMLRSTFDNLFKDHVFQGKYYNQCPVLKGKTHIEEFEEKLKNFQYIDWKIVKDIWQKKWKDDPTQIFNVALTQVTICFLNDEGGPSKWIQENKHKYEVYKKVYRFVLKELIFAINKIHGDGKDPKLFNLSWDFEEDGILSKTSAEKLELFHSFIDKIY